MFAYNWHEPIIIDLDDEWVFLLDHCYGDGERRYDGGREKRINADAAFRVPSKN